MKNLLWGSFVLLLFSASVLLMQISCRKNAVASPPGTGITQLNKLIYFKAVPQSVGNSEIWIANYDGTDANRINISLPAGSALAGENGVKLSPDGTQVFFVVREITGTILKQHIYRCGIDGSNLQKIVEGAINSTQLLYLEGVY